jgi:phage-related protein
LCLTKIYASIAGLDAFRENLSRSGGYASMAWLKPYQWGAIP